MQVGVIGLGIMGRAMAAKLLEAGYPVVVHNRTQSRAADLIAQGARWAETPACLAAQCDVVISVVTDPHAVMQISLESNGVLAQLPATSVHCDMSTITPEAARQIAERYRAQGKRFVQAPVLGSRKQIALGELLVFGGGSEADVQRCEPVWKVFSQRVWHLPTAEAAATLKLACNLLIAHMILGLGQSLIFAGKGGVAPALLLDVLSASALACPMYASKGRTLLERNFNANFVVRNMLKDLNLATEAGQQCGAPLLHNALSRELFSMAVQQGFGEEDYSAVVKVLEGLAGYTLATMEERAGAS